MIEIEVGSALLRLILDGGMTIFFARRMDNAPSPRPVLALLCLLPTAFLYIPYGFPLYPDSALLRYLLRTAAVFAYLLMGKKKSKKDLLYTALLFCLCLTTCQNLFMTPLLGALRNMQVTFWGIPWADMLTARLVEYLITWAIIWLCDWTLRIHEIQNVGWLQFGICLLLTLINISVKHILKLTEIASSSSNVFPLFICLATLLLLLLTEYYIGSAQKAVKAKIALAVQEYQYKRLLAVATVDESTRKLRHDMKNHIIALRALSHQPEKLTAYLNAMSAELEPEVYVVQTGNSLLDALLSQKYQMAKELSVRLNCCADFTKVNFLRDIDLCTIVGNGLDNAIEAAASVPDAERRLVTFKTAWRGNTLLLKIENYYLHEPRQQNGVFITRKSGEGLHGYGMRNMRDAVERYGGSVSGETIQDKLFRLVVLLPAPQS